jgi:hypothetical protein
VVGRRCNSPHPRFDHARLELRLVRSRERDNTRDAGAPCYTIASGDEIDGALCNTFPLRGGRLVQSRPRWTIPAAGTARPSLSGGRWCHFRWANPTRNKRAAGMDRGITPTANAQENKCQKTRAVHSSSCSSITRCSRRCNSAIHRWRAATCRRCTCSAMEAAAISSAANAA